MHGDQFTLEQDEKHFGFWCAAGTEVDTFERSGTLSRDQMFRHVLLPQGSRFWHDVDFDYVSVRSNGPIRVRGHVFGDETVVEFSPRSQWEVWRSSLIPWLLLPLTFPLFLLGAAIRRYFRWMTIVPSDAMEIDGVPIERGDRVKLRSNGTLGSLLLHTPRTVGGRRFDTGHLRWDRRGRLRDVLLYRPQVVDGIPCAGLGLQDTEVEFWPDGSLRSCVLAEEHVIDEVPYPRGARLRFDGEGRPRQAGTVNLDVAVYASRPEVHQSATDAATREEESTPLD